MSMYNKAFAADRKKLRPLKSNVMCEKMNFEKVDQAFYDWANNSGLNVQIEYKGEEVRSVDIFDIYNQKWQLWLVPIDSEDKCVIHYWNYKDIGRHSKVPIPELLKELSNIERAIKTGTVKKSYLP